MNQVIDAILSFLLLLKNKLLSIGVLLVLGTVYRSLPQDQPIPFAEVLYAIILVSTIMVIAPIMRMLVFNEAAVYAESGALDKDLASSRESLSYKHYRFATAVCYLSAIVCVSALASL
jgi:hypothetical protein